MKRAQIYLGDEEYEALRAAAFKQRASISSVLRGLVQVSIIGKPKKKRYAAGLLELAKQLNLHDTKRDVSERHDEYAWVEES